MAGSSSSPCASCKLLRRRCANDCVFAPFFPPEEPRKFAIVHKVFGASNVSKMLQELPAAQRADAVSSLVYEANARLRDPVYGCVGAISCLQQQVAQLQMQLAVAKAEILCVQMQQQQQHDASLPQQQQQHQQHQSQQLCADDKAFLVQNGFINSSMVNFTTASGNVVFQEALKRESLWT